MCSFLSIQYSPLNTWQGIVSDVTGTLFLIVTMIVIYKLAFSLK